MSFFEGCLLLIATVALIILLGTVIVMFGWNISIAVIFGLPKIGLLEAFGLMLVSGALLGPRAAYASTKK